jgi:hypothetical protein
MARKRTRRASPRRFVRTRTSAPKRVRRRSRKSSGNSKLMDLVFAGAYGAMRQPISNAVAPLANRVPIINASDEVALMVTAWGAKKVFKNRTVTKLANTAMIVEASRLGSTLINTGGFGIFSGGKKENGLMQTVF